MQNSNTNNIYEFRVEENYEEENGSPDEEGRSAESDSGQDDKSSSSEAQKITEETNNMDEAENQMRQIMDPPDTAKIAILDRNLTSFTGKQRNSSNVETPVQVFKNTNGQNTNATHNLNDNIFRGTPATTG